MMGASCNVHGTTVLQGKFGIVNSTPTDGTFSVDELLAPWEANLALCLRV